MKFLLYLLCWAGFGANIYYNGIAWWTFVLFVVCLGSVKWTFDSHTENVRNLRESGPIVLLMLFGIYFAVLLIYSFSGDGQVLARAAGFLTSSLTFGKWAANFIAGFTLLLLFGSSGSRGAAPRRSHADRSDDRPVYVAGPEPKPEFMEVRRQEHENAVTHGFKDEW